MASSCNHDVHASSACSGDVGSHEQRGLPVLGPTCNCVTCWQSVGKEGAESFVWFQVQMIIFVNYRPCRTRALSNGQQQRLKSHVIKMKMVKMMMTGYDTSSHPAQKMRPIHECREQTLPVGEVNRPRTRKYKWQHNNFMASMCKTQIKRKTTVTT